MMAGHSAFLSFTLSKHIMNLFGPDMSVSKSVESQRSDYEHHISIKALDDINPIFED